jgi:hypothetical protein
MLVDAMVAPYMVHGPFVLDMATGSMQGKHDDWPSDAEQMVLCQTLDGHDRNGQQLYEGCIVKVYGVIPHWGDVGGIFWVTRFDRTSGSAIGRRCLGKSSQSQGLAFADHQIYIPRDFDLVGHKWMDYLNFKEW